MLGDTRELSGGGGKGQSWQPQAENPSEASGRCLTGSLLLWLGCNPCKQSAETVLQSLCRVLESWPARDCPCNCYHPGGPRSTSQENKEHPLSGTFKDRISTQKNQDMGTWKASFGSDTCAPGGRGSVKDGGTLPEAGRGESKKRGENGGTHQLQQWEAGKKEEKGEKKKKMGLSGFSMAKGSRTMDVSVELPPRTSTLKLANEPLLQKVWVLSKEPLLRRP